MVYFNLQENYKYPRKYIKLIFYVLNSKRNHFTCHTLVRFGDAKVKLYFLKLY